MRSLELFGEEDDRAATVAADGTGEDGLIPRGGTQVVHGGVQQACMSEREAWTSTRTEG